MSTVGYIKETIQAVFNLENPWKTACIAIGSYVVAKKGLTLLLREFGKKYMQASAIEMKFEDDIVYLFLFPREFTKQCPNLSPYAIKVETWLKLKKIKYEIVETTTFSQDSRQIPYIQLNGNYVSDSTMIIRYLTEHFKLDSSEGLSLEQRGAARAFQRMIDEATSWTYLLDRYVYRPEIYAKVFRPRAQNKYIRERIRTGLANMFKTRAFHQGCGRHHPRAVTLMGLEDLKAISWYVGDKQFLTGDEIREVDCALFGHLSQIAFVDFPYAHKELLNNECANIRHYLFRIREKLWPDWFVRSDTGEFLD